MRYRIPRICLISTALLFLFLSGLPQNLLFAENKTSYTLSVMNAEACFGETVKITVIIEQDSLKEGDLKLDIDIMGFNVPNDLYSSLLTGEESLQMILGINKPVKGQASGDSVHYIIGNSEKTLTLKPLGALGNFQELLDVAKFAGLSIDITVSAAPSLAMDNSYLRYGVGSNSFWAKSGAVFTFSDNFFASPMGMLIVWLVALGCTIFIYFTAVYEALRFTMFPLIGSGIIYILSFIPLNVVIFYLLVLAIFICTGVNAAGLASGKMKGRVKFGKKTMEEVQPPEPLPLQPPQTQQQPQSQSVPPDQPPTGEWFRQGDQIQTQQPSQASPAAIPGPPVRYPCSTCGRPLEWDTRYQRWFCTNCRRYY